MKILLTGDVHGNYKYYRKFLKHVRELNDEVDTVISLGDFGYDYSRNFLRYADMALRDYGFRGYFLRGNHDDKRYLERMEAQGRTRLTDRLTYLPDGTVLELGGLRFGILGGATSSDRQWRIEGESWWEGENVDRDAAGRLIAQGNIDVLLTHDLPVGGGPEDWPGRIYGSPDIQAEADAGRAIITDVLNTVPSITHLFHGHLHYRYTRPLPLDDGRKIHLQGFGCDGDNYSAFGDIFETGYYL